MFTLAGIYAGRAVAALTASAGNPRPGNKASQQVSFLHDDAIARVFLSGASRSAEEERSMQVYLALYDEDDDYLVAKKKVINSWWQRKQRQPARVNQAGQWCFPGGRTDGRDLIQEAKREFQEETGCIIPACDQEDLLSPSRHYRLVRCRIAGGKLNILMRTANARIGAGRSAPRPRGGVKDWGLSEFTMVPKSRLASYVGTSSPVQQDISSHLAGPYSQAIDWYGEMALCLMER